MITGMPKLTIITTLTAILLGYCILLMHSGDKTGFGGHVQKLIANSDFKEVKNLQVEPDTIKTMNKLSLVRISSLEGGVSLFVNGFLIFSDETEGNAFSQLAPYVKPGVNIFELVPKNSDKKATLKVIDMSAEDAVSITAPTLLTLSTEDIVGSSVIGKLTMEGDISNFSWHKATEVENLEVSADEIYLKLKALAKALENGDEELKALLSIKHEEMATIFDFPKEDMDSGLLGGLEARRTNPEFRIDLVSREDFFPLLSTNKTIVNAMRSDGSHAIKIMDGTRNSEFTVSLAKIEGKFVIVR